MTMISDVASIPVAVLSTSCNNRDIDYCNRHGAMLITKPMYVEELEDVARALLAHCSVSHQKA